MKIGLLNPWRNAAENQLIPALGRAAGALGHAVVECKNTQDVLRHCPDFVLSMSRTQPKLTDIPTYGLIFDPRDILLEEASYVYGILSYDGVFTIFDTLRDFLSDLMFAAGRDPAIGYFYPTATTVAWDEPVRFADARLAYFGINWDRRRHGLFALLDHQPWMEIYGPEIGWSHLDGESYRGMVPFDGTGVLERYHRAGAGLCLFSASHVADNIVTSRVFEICAAEAVVIAPRIPWLEQHFGDAVLYIDQDRDDAALADEIAGHVAWIREHPEEARALAARSHQIFREQFSLDVLLPNVLRLHERVQAERGTAQQASDGAPRLPTLSVVVPCFDCAPAALARSLNSVVRQGPYDVDVQVILAPGAAPEPFEAVARTYRQRVQQLTLVQAATPWQSTAVLAALQRCTGEFIAVLTGGDTWLPNHLPSMLRAVGSQPGQRLGIAGSIIHHQQAFATRGGNQEHRRLLPFPHLVLDDDPVAEALRTPVGSLLFHRSLLTGRLLTDPKLGAAADAHLVLCLLEQETPACTMRATMLHEERPAQSAAGRAPADEVVRLRTRFIGRVFPPAARTVNLEALQSLVERSETRRQLDTGRLVRRDGVAEYRIPAAFEHLIGTEATWEPISAPLALDDMVFGGQSRPADPAAILPLLVAPPAEAWADGLVWRVRLPEDRPYVVRLACRIESGTAGFGILSAVHHQFDYRVFVSSQEARAVVDLPIRHPRLVEGVVIQSTVVARPVRVVVEDVQVYAARARFPLAAVERFADENAELRVTLNTVERRREVLASAVQAVAQQHDDLTAARERLHAGLQAISQRESALTAESERQRSSLHAALDTARTERRVLATQLEEQRRQVREMRDSRLWRLGKVYWRLRALLRLGPR